MLDPRLFRVRGFSAGALTVLVQFFASFGFFFVVLQYLQFVVGTSPLEAAPPLLPLPLVMIPLARNAPRIARRVGFRRLAPIGLLLTATGLVVISTIGVDLSYWHFAIGLVAVRRGHGAGRHAVDDGDHRVAPGEQAGRRLGCQRHRSRAGQRARHRDPRQRPQPALPRRMASAVHGLPSAVAEQVKGSIAFTQSPKVEQFGAAGRHFVAAAQQAYVDGIGGALGFAAAVLAIAAVAVFLLAPPAAEPTPASDDPA